MIPLYFEDEQDETQDQRRTNMTCISTCHVEEQVVGKPGVDVRIYIHLHRSCMQYIHTPKTLDKIRRKRYLSQVATATFKAVSLCSA